MLNLSTIQKTTKVLAVSGSGEAVTSKELASETELNAIRSSSQEEKAVSTIKVIDDIVFVLILRRCVKKGICSILLGALKVYKTVVTISKCHARVCTRNCWVAMVANDVQATGPKMKHIMNFWKTSSEFQSKLIPLNK